jgi:hypothetical protein
MTIQVSARGRVATSPEEVQSGDGETVAAFMLADHHIGSYGDEEFPLEHGSVCEVVVRGATADRVLSFVKVGDAFVALGILRIAVPFGVANEADLVSLSIDAYSIGIDLAAVAVGN